MIKIIFNGQVSSDSMGGGDKIVINIASLLYKKGLQVGFIGCPEGHAMVNREVPHLNFLEINKVKASKWGIVPAYVIRILVSLKMIFLNLGKDVHVWSASDYLPDSIPGFIYKIFHSDSKWLINMFLDARNPFSGEVPFKKNFVLSYISQRITLWLFRLKGDHVFVLSYSDVNYLKSLGIPESKITRIFGGVNMQEFDAVPTPSDVKYEACYVGRFHEQKGLPEMIYAWSEVVKKMPNAKLAIVGWGAEVEVTKLKDLIASHSLEANTEMLGFLDGREKIEVIKSSKILLFPSNYESWGVSLAEGIACGIPVVSFALPQIKDNFKGGVYWVEPKNKLAYASAVLEVLTNEELQKRCIEKGNEIRHTLTWDYSADMVYAKLFRL